VQEVTHVSTHPQLVVHRTFDRAVIVMSGEFDLDESRAIEELALDLFAELTATVDLDMADVTFLGSRALAAVLFLRTEVARHSGAEIRIIGCSEPVLRLFELTGVLELLHLGPALAEPSLAVKDVA
jgi:anti-sigma B factor antagonist